MKVLLFDIDGTLIDAGGAGQAAMEAAMDQQFGARKQVSGISTAGRTDRAIAYDLFEFHGVEINEANWMRYLTSYYQLLPAALKDHRGEILPGIGPLMAQLSRRDDLVLGLLTGNFANGAKLKLDHYGLDHHFAFGGFGDDHLDRDDVAREAFNTVRSRIPDVVPDQIWVIGDTPSDIRCGRAIGAKVLSVATGVFSADELQTHRPDVCLEDLSDPATWLKIVGIL